MIFLLIRPMALLELDRDVLLAVVVELDDRSRFLSFALSSRFCLALAIEAPVFTWTRFPFLEKGYGSFSKEAVEKRHGIQEKEVRRAGPTYLMENFTLLFPQRILRDNLHCLRNISLPCIDVFSLEIILERTPNIEHLDLSGAFLLIGVDSKAPYDYNGAFLMGLKKLKSLRINMISLPNIQIPFEHLETLEIYVKKTPPVPPQHTLMILPTFPSRELSPSFSDAMKLTSFSTSFLCRFSLFPNLKSLSLVEFDQRYLEELALCDQKLTTLNLTTSVPLPLPPLSQFANSLKSLLLTGFPMIKIDDVKYFRHLNRVALINCGHGCIEAFLSVPLTELVITGIGKQWDMNRYTMLNAMRQVHSLTLEGNVKLRWLMGARTLLKRLRKIQLNCIGFEKDEDLNELLAFLDPLHLDSLSLISIPVNVDTFRIITSRFPTLSHLEVKGFIESSPDASWLDILPSLSTLETLSLEIGFRSIPVVRNSESAKYMTTLKSWSAALGGMKRLVRVYIKAFAEPFSLQDLRATLPGTFVNVPIAFERFAIHYEDS